MAIDVKADVYTQVWFLEVKCPKCGTYITLYVDEDAVMTPEGEELCDVSEIDDVHVDKEFKCTECGETLRLTGGKT